MFSGQATWWDELEFCQMFVYTSKIKDGGQKPGLEMTLRIYQLVHMIAMKLQRLYPCFRGWVTQLDYYCGDYPTSKFGRNRRWWPATESRNDITFISAFIHDSNVIPTAIPMLRSSYPAMFSVEQAQVCTCNYLFQFYNYFTLRLSAVFRWIKMYVYRCKVEA